MCIDATVIVTDWTNVCSVGGVLVCRPPPYKYSTIRLSCKEFEYRKQQCPLRRTTSRSDGFPRFRSAPLAHETEATLVARPDANEVGYAYKTN